MIQTPTDVEAVRAEAQALFDRLTWDEDLRALFRKLPDYAETDATDTFPLKVLADYLRDFGLDWIPDLVQTDVHISCINMYIGKRYGKGFTFWRNGVGQADRVIVQFLNEDLSPALVLIRHGWDVHNIETPSPP